MPSRFTVATQLTSAGSRMPVLSRLNWNRLPSANALIVVDALNCLIRSDVSGMSTLTEWAEITRPSTLNGERPSKVRTMGNVAPGLSDQLLFEKPRFQVTFRAHHHEHGDAALVGRDATHPVNAPVVSLVNAPPLEFPILTEP